jgi:iron complex transport system ATP-binding protein
MNNLDFLAQAIFKKTLHRLIQAGIQVLLVTHQNTDINEDIDRVLLLKKGRLVADGKRTAVLNKNLLSQVFQTPAKFFS